MPFPLIPVAVIAIASVAALIAWAVIKSNSKGKKLLLLGQRESGKTTMACLIDNNKLPDGYKRTPSKKKYPARKIDLTELELYVSTVDMPGEEEAKYSQWKKAFSDCDWVFYLIRADLFIADDRKHIERVARDIREINEWLKKNQKKVVIVATHEDKVDGCSLHVCDALAGLEKYKMAVNMLNPEYRAGPVVGSMASIEAGKDLIFRAIKEAQG